MKKHYLFCLLILPFLLAATFKAVAQQPILNPNDTLVVYDSLTPPTQPAWNTPGKWVYTPGNYVTWNTSQWKAYIFNGITYRILFPSDYLTNPTKVFPVVLFLHGEGELGNIYNNQAQLYHCAQQIQNAENNGTFDGFAVFPQSQYGGWYASQFANIVAFLNYMFNNARADRFAVSINGLSSGGDGTDRFTQAYPQLFAASIPMSPTNSGLLGTPAYIDSVKSIPFWISQGALDADPIPGVTTGSVSNMVDSGMDIVTAQPGQEGAVTRSEGYYIIYPNNGHNTWDAHYQEPLAISYMMDAYKSNPHVVNGRRQFCPGTPIHVTLTLTQGFTAYQWARDGVVISGATTNTLTVKDTGTYSAQILDDSVWSDWSHWPASITYSTPTYTPPIQVSGLMSRVIPAPNGNTSVNLTEQPGYAQYQWMDSTGNVVGTNQVFTATAPGYYTASVTPLYGCSSIASAPFYVASNSGPNPPSAAADLTGYALSSTSIQLNWSQNLHPVNKQTAFEIYRATQSGGPYTLAGIVPADTLGFADAGLSSGTLYYYAVRAIDSTGAAPLSPQDSITTIIDRQPPTAPGSLQLIGGTDNSISLAWNPSSDNVAVQNYYVYINGVRSYVTPNTSYTINGLTHDSAYTLTVKAVDPTGNISAPSNQVVAVAAYQGLTYYYYTYTGTWNSIPNLSALTPVSTGLMNNVSLSPATQTTNFAFSFQGGIRITAPGTYTFYTNSDDGSNLYINGTQVVNNDGPHGATQKSGTYTFSQAGVYPFRVDYFQGGGGYSLTVSWSATTPNIAMSAIPDSVFTEHLPPMAGVAPAKPTGITATANAYNRITVSWTNNSSNAKGFEVYRSADSGQTWLNVATVNAGATSLVDTRVAPATTYYYKVQAVNQYGSSGFDTASISGLSYGYYQPPLGTLTAIPNFNTLTPVSTGIAPNVTLSMAQRPTTFALKFTGPIKIPVSGQYTFYTTSDDGSNLYIDGMDSAHLVVANDHLQAPTQRSGNVTLTAGTHLIYITYFQAGGGDSLSTAWQGPGFSQQPIPDSAFMVGNVVTTPALPAVPSAPYSLKANALSGTSVLLAWNDTSNNVTGFNVYRSDGTNTSYRLLKQLPANSNYYSDSGLFANTTYYYKVAAVGLGGVSGYSNEVSAVTVPVETWYINFFQNSSGVADSPWNNILIPGIGTYNFSNLKDTNGNTTGVGINFPSLVQGTISTTTTGNNSGVYPDMVLSQGLAFGINGLGEPDTAYSIITGLNKNNTYTITLFPDITWGQDANSYSVYQIGTIKDSVNNYNNTSRTAIFKNISPDGNGNIQITMTKGGTAQAGALNAMVITQGANVSPIPPLNAQATSLPGDSSKVKVSWIQGSNNTDSVKIYRSISRDSAYTLLNPGMANGDSTSYIDSTVAPNTTYYYYLVAANGNGNSAPSDTGSITITVPPVIDSIGNVAIQPGTSDTIHIQAQAVSGMSLTLTASGLPAFATFTDLGNGQGQIVAQPGSSDAGSYLVTIQAKDNLDDSASRQFTIHVIDTTITTVDINFNGTNNVGMPWNNTAFATPQAGYSAVNLLNTNGTPSGINLTFQESWAGSTTSGAVTGNNTGIYPDSVMQTGYWDNSGTDKHLVLSGLSVSKKYNISLFGSVSGSGTQTTVFMAGGQTDSENVINNTTQAVRFTNLSPDSTGSLTITVNRGANTTNSYLNAMVIQGYDSSLVVAPTNVSAVSNSTSAVNLTWVNNDGHMTGTQVWRATAANGPYSLVTTLMNDTTAYTDNNGLSNNTRYFYKLRTLRNTDTSGYSAMASATTVQYSVYVNFDQNTPGPVPPWNNTNMVPNPGNIFNLNDSQGNVTGIVMEDMGGFSGVNPWGVITGNNSGIYPDNVIGSTYWVDANDTGKVQLQGLDLSKSYNLTFFGSRTAGAGTDRTTIYTANGQKASLQAANDTFQTVTIYNVTPDATGNIHIGVTNGGASPYGYIGALVIQPHNNYDSNGNVIINPQLYMFNRGMSALPGRMSLLGDTSGFAIRIVKVYPNPFSDVMHVVLSSPHADRMMFSLVGSNGQVVDRQLIAVSEGINTIEYRPINQGAPGFYVLQIQSMTTGKAVNVKLIKQ